MVTRNFAVFADCLDANQPVEVNSIEKQKNRLLTETADLTQTTKEALLSAQRTLPFFAEIYNISANLNDYVLVPLPLMLSSLPNRNGVGFKYSELTKASAELGCLGYQTWINKCCHQDHQNQDHTKAKGIILSTSMQPMRNVKGNVWKVMALTAWDRTNDPILVNSILTGERKFYSMGAYCSHFSCTICGAKHPKEECDHVSLRKPKMQIVNGQLAFLKAKNMAGFEVSSVLVPAFVVAKGISIMNLNS